MIFRNHCARLCQCMNYLDLEILSHALSVTKGLRMTLGVKGEFFKS